MLAVGLLLGVHPQAAPPTEHDVELVSFDSALMPDSPVAEEVWWYGRSGSNRPERNDPAAVATDPAQPVRPTIGPGGWLIGDGADAAADCAGAACNGRAAGLL